MSDTRLGWLGIVRLGLVQTALGAIVVLATSTINRVMVVELALPAIVPGCLVALHYAIQILRPRWGHGSDVGGRKTPWIVGGMAVLALGAIVSAAAVALAVGDRTSGILLAVAGFLLIGAGVGASGTSLLVLLAAKVAPERRPAAASVVWMMMIAGFVVTTVLAGHLLDPFSPARLVQVVIGVATIALGVTTAAVWGIEGHGPAATSDATPQAHPSADFRTALRQVWHEPDARRLALFVFVSMLAYSAEELLLDPFAGVVFGYSPGQSTRLSGVLHGGVLVGMLVVALGSSIGSIRSRISLRHWTTAGCLGSACALVAVALGGLTGPDWPLRPTVFVLGVLNGCFAVAAIGSMMSLVGRGRAGREGVRMGVWGAAQGVAFGLGGVLGSGASDLARHFAASPGSAYAMVFVGEAVLFAVAAAIAIRLPAGDSAPRANAVRAKERAESARSGGESHASA